MFHCLIIFLFCFTLLFYFILFICVHIQIQVQIERKGGSCYRSRIVIRGPIILPVDRSYWSDHEYLLNVHTEQPKCHPPFSQPLALTYITMILMSAL